MSNRPSWDGWTARQPLSQVIRMMLLVGIVINPPDGVLLGGLTKVTQGKGEQTETNLENQSSLSKYV